MTAIGMTVLPAFAADGDTGGPGAAPQYPVVAAGLDNPRGLAIADNGDIYVAESGHGGESPCMPSADDPTVDACFGATGAITRIHNGTATQVVTGLPSLAPQVATQGGQVPPGAQSTGPSAVVVSGADEVTFTIGLGTDPANRDSKLAGVTPIGHLFGTLSSSSVPGTADDVTMLADVSAFEGANDPVPGANGPDSNPNALITDGDGYAVVDAGGNDLLHVDAAGNVSLMTTFPASSTQCPPPPIPPEAVPTSVVRGPDGALYVGELTGFPFCEGGASIYRVDSSGNATVYASGLTNVTGLAFGSDGTLYAVEIAQHGLQKGPIGALVAIPSGGGTAMSDYQIVAGGLMAPYGIAISGDSAYLTVGSILPITAGGGSVVKIALNETAPTSSASSSASSSAGTSSSSAPTSTWSVLPGSTGDPIVPAAGSGIAAWIVATGGLLLLGSVMLMIRRRQRTRGGHA